MLDKERNKHARACARSRTRAPTYRQICNTYCFSTAKMIRELVSVLRYTYIALLFCTTVTRVLAKSCAILVLTLLHFIF
jgi:hypothetical protein